MSMPPVVLCDKKHRNDHTGRLRLGQDVYTRRDTEMKNKSDGTRMRTGKK